MNGLPPPPSAPARTGHPRQFTLDVLISAGLVVLLAIIYLIDWALDGRVVRAHQLRYRSYLLADELRQSGDDLTRMIRSYAATADPIYKLYFQDILDIRNGVQRRPKEYWRPYWDLVVGQGRRPRTTESAVALLDLMRAAGFTTEEFNLLAQAKTNSDALTGPEFEAMRLVESSGPEAAAHRAAAVNLLYDPAYRAAKFGVMQPIDQFIARVDQRTLAAAQAVQTQSLLLRGTAAAVGLGLIFMLWRSYAALRGALGGSLDQVQTQIATIGRGDFSISFAPAQFTQGSVMAWLAATRDQLHAYDRERRQSESAMRASEQHFRVTFEQTAIGFALVSLAGRFDRVNATLCAIVGYSNAELSALTFQQITHPDDLDADLALVRQVLNGEISTYTLEKRYIRKDQSLVWINLTVSLARDAAAAPDYFIATIEDISKRKQAEETLRTRDLELQLIMDSTPALISFIDADHRYRRVNKSYERWFGLSAEQVCGQTVREILGEAAWTAVQPLMARALAGESISFERQIAYRLGGVRWVQVSYNPSRRPSGEIDGFVVHVMDIAELKRAEAEVLQLNAALEQRVLQRTAELAAANKELEAFAYSVSHDLRAPLRAIDGFSQVLFEDYAPRLDDEARDSLQRVRAAAQRMGHLIDDLLMLSRVTRSELNIDRVDLSALAESVAATLQRSSPARKVELSIAHGILLRSDARLLQIVLENLFSNAWKFTSRSSAARIEFVAHLQAGELVCQLRDNGAGFDMVYADHLFQPFQRLHSPADFPGAGIGLATVKRAITRLGGRVWAEAAVGQGATFSFALPDVSN